jgi:hypothetical protein
MVDADSESKSIAYKIVNVVFDIVGCVIFLAFVLYWEKKSANVEKYISKEIKLESAQTVEVTQFPNNSN